MYIKKIRLIMLMIAYVFCLSLNTFALPITLYDADLLESEKEELIKTYNEIEINKEQTKNNNTNEDKNNNDYIDTNNEKDIVDDIDYIKTEEELFKDKDIDLSVTKIDDSYNYRIINKNNPDFDVKDYENVAFEDYQQLDSLGRCTVATALLGLETMPKTGEERESLAKIKPSGWQLKKYDIVEGKYIYNRCHLIGWQLSAENANERNLFTGTRYLNTKGMLPFENQIANYIKTTNNHVLYRVTPIFEGNNLVASRVHLEALSYEDNGSTLKFNVLLENYQPGIHINYQTGETYEEVATNSVIYFKNDMIYKVT